MKRFFFVPLLLLCTSTLIAQTQPLKLPEFGKVDVADLKMTDCPFEKDASAMMIFNTGESIFQLTGFEQTEHRVRIKIFNQKGFGQANIKIRYPSWGNEVSVKHLVAQTYNLDDAGNVVVTRVEKNSIYDKKISKRTSEITFAFPNVKAGSIIEYKYVMDGSTEGVWYFQHEIPVQYSRFSLSFPAELIVNMIPYCTMPFDKKSGYESNNSVTTFTMENIPGLSDEAYMSCREDYLQRVEAKLAAIDFPGVPRKNLLPSWPQVVRMMMEDEDFGMQLKKNIPRTADLDAMLKTITDPYTKMCIIHKYVRDNMEWNKMENIWALDGVKSAWKDKKGTSGEINLILINLLKDAELDAHPVLVSTRENGMINVSDPGFNQFNKVMAYVNLGSRVYVLDATEKDNPSYLIPQEVMDSEGLLIEKISSFEWGWKVLWDGFHKKKKDIFINAELKDNGALKGTARITSTDYAKTDLLPLLRLGNEKMKETLVAGINISIDSFNIDGNAADTLPIAQEIGFTAPTRTSGDYHYFNLNLFSGLEKNPFVEDERQTDIFFGTNQLYSIISTIEIPENYKMEELPKNTRLMMPDTSIVFVRRSSFNGGLLSVSISLEFRSPIYMAADYDYFREFYKKLFELLNESFVYTKK